MKTRAAIGTAAVSLMLAGMTACLTVKRQAGDYPTATVLYAAQAPQDVRLFLADGDGRNERQLLAESGYDYNPSLSTDGRWVVFTSERGGSPDLYRVRVDGSGLERLTDHPAFDDAGVLSPDGTAIALVSTRGGGNANIWLLDLATRNSVNLTAGSPGDYRPTWSPDSQWIAFSSIRDAPPLRPGDDPALRARRFPSSNLYVIRRNGSGLRRVTTSGSVFSPRWAADGRRIIGVDIDRPDLEALAEVYFTSREQRDAISGRLASRVVAIDVADGGATEFAQGQGSGSIQFPQVIAASRVVYATRQGIRFNTGETGAQGQFANPSWSADGRIMVFHRRLGPPAGGALGSPTAFKLRTALDPDFRLLRTDDFPSRRPLHGGTEILMGHPLAPAGLLAASPDGARSRVIFRDAQRSAGAAAVSPNGEYIAFVLGARGFVSEGTTSHLALVRADGSGIRELGEAGDHAGYPDWSPDGTRLVYMHGAPAEERGLRILDLASGKVTTLTTGYDNFPAWSPSGDRIAFTRSPRGLAGASQIYSVRPDGNGLTRLTLSPGAQDAHPAWSPDGKWIAFTSARINPREEIIGAISAHHGIGQIFVMRDDGTDVRQLTDTTYNSGTPAWLPIPAPE